MVLEFGSPVFTPRERKRLGISKPSGSTFTPTTTVLFPRRSGGGGRSRKPTTGSILSIIAQREAQAQQEREQTIQSELSAKAETQRQADITAGTIAGQIESAKSTFRDTGQIQEIGQPPSFSQEAIRGFGGTVDRVKGFLGATTQIPFFRVPTGGVSEVPTLGGAIFQRISRPPVDTNIVTRETSFGIGGSIPITDITEELKKSDKPSLQFIGGGIEAVAGTPGEIAKFTIPFALGGAFAIAGKGAVAGATALGLGRFVPTASKITGIVLGGTFLAERGFTFSQTETPEEKGAFFAETGVGLGAFVGGQKVVSSFFKPLPSKADIVVFKGVEQKLFETSGITRTRLEFGTTSGRKGVSEVFNIPAGKDFGKDISVSFARGTTFKNVFEIPRGIRPKAETPFSSIIVSESQTAIGRFEFPTAIEGVLSQKDIPVTISKSRFGVSRFGIEPAKEVKTATLGVKLDDFTIFRGGVGAEGRVTEFRGVTGRFPGVAKDTKLFGIGRLPGARRGRVQEIGDSALIQKAILERPASSLDFAKAQTISALPKTFIPTEKPSVAGLGLVGIQRAVGGLGLDAFQIPRGGRQRFDISGVGVTKQDFGKLDFVSDIAGKGKLDFVSKVGQDVLLSQFSGSGSRQAQTPIISTKQIIETQTKQFQTQIPKQKTKQKTKLRPRIPLAFKDPFSPLVFSRFGGVSPIGGIIPPTFPGLGGFGSPRITRKGKKVKRKIRPSFTGAVLELEIGLPKGGIFGISPFDIRGLPTRKKSKKKSKGKVRRKKK